MKNLNLTNAAVLTCCLIVSISCKKDDKSNAPLVIEESIPVSDYDGNVYKTVRIGNQIWMAENCDGYAATNYVYNNDQTNVTKYGRLYHWTVAMRNHPSSALNPSGIQGVSPDGWHIPSDSEWLELISDFGEYSEVEGKLVSCESLFNAFPGGFYRQDGQFLRLGEWGIFLTSTSVHTEWYDGITIIEFYEGHLVKQSFELYNAGSIRCVKNNL